jgi:hypothetical protein
VKKFLNDNGIEYITIKSKKTSLRVLTSLVMKELKKSGWKKSNVKTGK